MHVLKFNHYEVIFLDVGDTLVGSEPELYERFKFYCEKLGLNINMRDLVTAYEVAELWLNNKVNKLRTEPYQYIDIPKEIWWKYNMIILENCGVVDDNLYTLAKKIEEHFDEEMTTIGMKTYTHLYDDVRPFLETIKSSFTGKLGIISNATERIYPLLDYHDIRKYFDAVIASFEVGIEKPGKKIFTRAVERFNARPEKCLHIGNHPVCDYQGARNAGLDAILIDRTNKYPEFKGAKISTFSDC